MFAKAKGFHRVSSFAQFAKAITRSMAFTSSRRGRTQRKDSFKPLRWTGKAWIKEKRRETVDTTPGIDG